MAQLDFLDCPRIVQSSRSGGGEVTIDTMPPIRLRPFFLIALLMQCAQICAADPSPLTPDETAKRFTLPPGFSLTVFASEPEIVQPIGMAIDDRGRIWIAESLSYPDWKPEGHDRITILEDTDGDGRADKRTVFYDKLNYVTGLEIGFGGVWVVTAPSLLFIPDKDHDDKPDGPPVVMLDGFGHQGIHNLVNGCVWGPDGWLYGGHGHSSSGFIGAPGTPEKDRLFFDGGVWRYHPTKHRFESFMEGTTNPWGLDFDEYGQAFITNSVTPHLYHAVQGAHVERRDPTINSKFAYGLIDTIADHKHWVGDAWTKSGGGKPEQLTVGGGHAHSGCMIYLGDQFPDKYRGGVYMNNIHGDRANCDILEHKGSGYVAHHGEDFLTCSDPWYQGLQLRYGPDGSVYLTDWYDTGECHTRKPSVGNGRVYRITYGEKTRAKPPVDLSTLPSGELIKLQTHHNEWFVRHARRILQERGPRYAINFELRLMFEKSSDAVQRLRYLWALHGIGEDSEVHLQELLDDPQPWIRAWAIQLLCEDKSPADETTKRFESLVEKDESPVVCLYLASACQRMSAEQRWPILEKLAARDAFASDQNIPLMTWYALEPLVTGDPKRALSLAAKSKFPHLREYVARRIASSEK